MLGLIESAALAPLALAFAVVPGQSNAARAGLALLAGVGIAAADPGRSASEPVLERAARALPARPLARAADDLRRAASGAWAPVSVSWLLRAAALVLLLGALGVGFSLALAFLYLSAGAAAGALPIAPAGATKAGAGAAALIASGVGASEALDVALAGQALGVLCGVAILLSAVGWRVSHPDASGAAAWP